MNAANEVAVQAFLDRRIGFTDIPNIIEHTLSKISSTRDIRLEAVLSDDIRARELTVNFIASLEPSVSLRAT